MIAEVLKWGIGKYRCGKPRRSFGKFGIPPQSDKPGRVTTAEVYEEEKNIIETVKAGKGAYQPIGREKSGRSRARGLLATRPEECRLSRSAFLVIF